MTYVGRFSPSPSGPLHSGSLLTALASWLDARAHCGRWLLRIEDIDEPRCDPLHGERIMQCLRGLGLEWDGPVLWQTQRLARYREIFEQLRSKGLCFACGCSRKDLLAYRGKGGELRHPGFCPRQIAAENTAKTWRFKVEAGAVVFDDRLLGSQQQHPADECGDFVLRRADQMFAYQLVVVIDDLDQAISHVVRGEDLLGSTGRQILLQNALNAPQPRYMHVPLLCNEQGQKLSKQHGAKEIEWQSAPERCLNDALHQLGQEMQDGNAQQILLAATKQWDIEKIPRKVK
ncbi:MAG: tRNA glutamyl-Q(34) synthetase GluQRS [Oceanococcus sp.]